MKLIRDIEIIDLALKIGNNLVICDTHIGYEEYLNKIGVMVPRFQFREIIKRLEGIINDIKNKNINKISVIKNKIKINNKKNDKNLFNKIIVNGDIKHEFGTISEQEWRHTLRLLDFLKEYCNEIILIKGNHDTILGPIADKRGVKVVDYSLIDDTLIIHGGRLIGDINKKIKDNKNKIDFKKLKNIIIGHEHPAISLREGGHSETYKCYLVGKYRNKNLIVQPSFNLVTEGTDVLKEKLLSPYLIDISDFKVYVVEDKIYKFGKIRNLH